ncbi:putative solute-binding protein [Agitococcus lubricus]|uniref:TRAP-type C4-dicarboxylate transport system substrate-binding protein n=1 Tax=Agitococcus lubricus TaxID=1077255 RepID=A0A2T5J1V5_9GAMM|nr:putative solute-binding protein [Agitococcus lubricus]PTQ90425.1 hypothetical protein C8N29_103178 [Agitococcus lubricus]
MVHSLLNRTKRVTGLALALGLIVNAQAATASINPLAKPLNIKFCVYDIGGNSGDLYRYAKDMALAAKKWNVNATIKAYSDERVAAEDFKAGQCDGVALSTLRAKQFNPFIGSIDSIGSAPSYQHIKTLVSTFNNPQVAPLTINGNYQVVTVMPLGAAYVMVNNRHIDSIDKAAGKKVAVIDMDKAQAKIVQHLGAQAVSTDFYNFANLFNNGQVDVIAAPAVAFKPLELAKGLGDYGGIYRFPLTQVTGTILINRKHLSQTVPDLDERIAKIRVYALAEMDKAISFINKREQEIPSQYWLDLPEAEKTRYLNLMQDARQQLTKEGIYDPRMMALMKRVRCKLSPQEAECTRIN